MPYGFLREIYGYAADEYVEDCIFIWLRDEEKTVHDFRAAYKN